MTEEKTDNCFFVSRRLHGPFAEWIYELHVFKKKSRSRITTPKPDLELIERRLKQAVEMEKNRRKGL